MTQSRALITWGGWDGHEPETVAHLIAGLLRDGGVEADISDSLACFDDVGALCGYDLIVPIWTMSRIEKHQAENVSEAVARGTGLAGCHGGMCDAFRENVLWQFMTGANWVAHPGGDGVRYTVEIRDRAHELTEGLEDFEVATEQYYLQVDAANHVLATTRFPTVTWYHSANGPVDIPVAWTRKWGLGRVYYNALGHKANVIESGTPNEMLRRGVLWAARSKAAARAEGLRFEDYENPGKHF
jgi:hypothetical protein